MMNKNFRNIISGLLLSTSIFAQGPRVSDIPENLKQDAYSVVLSDHTDYQFLPPTTGNMKRSRTLTILEREGKTMGVFVFPCDQFSELKQFSCEVFSANGSLIRKYKKSDLTRTEYSESFASDGYYYVLAVPENISYPYTIKYEWEVKYKGGILSLEPFYPLQGKNQSIVKSSYTLALPDIQDIKHKAFNCSIQPSISNEKKGKSLHFSLDNFEAIANEPFGLTLIPHVYFAPVEFVYDGHAGSLKNWNEYGKWVNGLQAGRDILPENIKVKIRELTANCQTDRERTKVLYDFLGENTRYVSIQLGIGGFRPFPAAEVLRTGFGDCKGLSYLMKTLLNEMGIPAYYTEIHNEKKRIIPDFVSLNQTNHVILQVPLPGDTIWLECTNTTIPFGYVHQDIAGHDALVMLPDGGNLQRLPAYADSLNLQTNSIRIKLKENEGSSFSVSRKSYLQHYEAERSITKIDVNKQKDRLRKEIHLPNARVLNVSFEEDKSPSPSLTTNFDGEANFGNKTGSRWIIPVNSFQSLITLKSRKKRTQPVYLSNGYITADTIRIEIPENYVLESAPKPTHLDTEFGNFSSVIVPLGNKLMIIQKLRFKKGVHPVEKYEAFAEFINNASQCFDSKIILKKKEN